MKTKQRKADTGTIKSLFSQYTKAIVHMRQQMAAKRFGLMVGAGASRDLGFPVWPELLERIAAHPEVDAAELLGKASSHTSKSQLLFQHYRARRAEKENENAEFNKLELKVRAGWQKVVHECLYREVPDEIDDLKKKDRYLWALLPVIKKTRLTINYNFDDTIQQLLADAREPTEREETRGYVTIWNSLIHMYPRDGVIYHPNGFLPRRMNSEKPSEHLVFLEDTFADQLIDSMHGHYGTLMHQLAQTTRLLVGLSLDDATLKHLLRQSAQLYPGHFHYYVAFEGEKPTDAAYRRAVSDSNFEVYNLVTLFLNANEIAALGALLSMPDKEFTALADNLEEPIVYRYLVTGSVGVGKSTTVSHFNCFQTVDEWLEEKPQGMEKDSATLTPTERETIDKFVADQIFKKNDTLRRINTGIAIVDRAPLDAFAFPPLSEWPVKANNINEALKPEKKKWPLTGAHIIFLVGHPEVMAARALGKHKVFEPSALARQQEVLRFVYEQCGVGMSVIDTREKSVSKVVHEIATVIYRGEYKVADLQDVVDKIASLELKPNVDDDA